MESKIIIPPIEGLTFDADAHRYQYNGYPVFGVSEILSLSKLSIYDYIPPERLAKAQHFGNAVHKMLELHDIGRLNMDKLDINLFPILNQWMELKAQNNVQIHAIEAKIFNRMYMFAGRLDRFVDWNGQLAIVDFKTSVAENPLTKIQLAGYQIALESMIKQKVKARISIRFGIGKQPIVTQYTDANDARIFTAMLTVVNFGLKEKLLP